MKTIADIFALALLATIAACSDSDQPQKSKAQCSQYDRECGISQVPGQSTTPGDHGPSTRPTWLF
jgi:uncharacterized lipoprotein